MFKSIVQIEKENHRFLDLDSFLISQNTISLSGKINEYEFSVLNNLLLTLQIKRPNKITIILSNLSCMNFDYIFNIYEQILHLKKIGVHLTIQINGVISNLSLLLAVIQADEKEITNTSKFIINELTVTESAQRVKASDFNAYTKYYQDCSTQYMSYLSAETQLPIHTIKRLHDSINYFNKEGFLKLIHGVTSEE